MTDLLKVEALRATSMDSLIARYQEIKVMKKDLQHQLEARLLPLDHALETLQAVMKVKLEDEGQQSVKTAYGTAYLSTNTKADIVDFEALCAYIRTADAFELFQRRLSTSEVLAVNERGGEVPGVQISRTPVVRVRAPS